MSKLLQKLTKFRARMKSGQNAMIFGKKEKVKNDFSLFTFQKRLKNVFSGCAFLAILQTQRQSLCSLLVLPVMQPKTIPWC